MKIRSVSHNNHRRDFEIVTFSGDVYRFPYAKLEVAPSATNRIREVFVDKELGREGLAYILESGDEGSVHIDDVLEYNEDPTILYELLLYNLTLEVQKRVERSRLSKREIIRKLGTSAAQFYRLADQTNTRKSVKQMISLLHILDCEVDLTVRDRVASG